MSRTVLIDCYTVGIGQQPDLFMEIETFISLPPFHCLHRRGQQLLLAKVKNADWQDWYILLYIENTYHLNMDLFPLLCTYANVHLVALHNNTLLKMHLLSLFVYTQVEFPEARIYEETLNVLLYENRGKAPDAELMQATKGYPAAAPGYHSDEDGDDRHDRFRRK